MSSHTDNSLNGRAKRREITGTAAGFDKGRSRGDPDSEMLPPALVLIYSQKETQNFSRGVHFAPPKTSQKTKKK